MTFVGLVDFGNVRRKNSARDEDLDGLAALDGEDAGADVELLARCGAHLYDGVDVGAVGELDRVGDDAVVGLWEVELGGGGREHFFDFDDFFFFVKF